MMWRPLRRDRWRAGPQADLSRLPVSVDLRAISLAEGVRAALAVAVILLIDEWLHLPLLIEAALAALLTCLCDTGGPVRRRVPALLAFAALGALATTGLGLLRPLGLPLVVPVATLLIFCTSYARVWGAAAMQVGNLLTVVVVLSLDHVEPAIVSWQLGGLFLGGSLWALLLTMVIWRLYPYRPARRSVADVFRRLGRMVADLPPLLEGQAPSAWEAHALAHRRHIRDGIEAARTMVMDTVRIRGGSSLRANQSVIQIEAAEQLFGVLIALSDVLEQAGPATRAAAGRALPALRLLLAILADDTARDQAEDDPAVRAMTGRLLAALQPLDAVPDLAGLAQSIVARLRIALLLTTPEGLLPGRNGMEPGSMPLRARVLTPVRANFGWGSATLRHAVRVAAVAGPALALTLSVGDAYAHWLTITLVLTLQPFFATTWQRALERSAGTVLGGVVAAGLSAVVHGPLATAAVLAPFAIASLAVRSVSYGLFIALLTPMVVLLSELAEPGQSELLIAVSRAGYTVLGGVLAVLGGVVLWPSWEPARVREAMADAIAAHARYADVEMQALEDPGTVPAVALETGRRAAGVASNALETALNRALQEPRQSARSEAQAAMVVDAALRRLVGRLLAMQHDPRLAGDDQAQLATWRTWFADAFQALEAGAALPSRPPPERDHPALGRMARQMELIAGALATPAPPAPGPTAAR